MPQTRDDILRNLGRDPTAPRLPLPPEPFARPTNAPGFQIPNEPTGPAPTSGIVAPATIKNPFVRKVLHNPDGSYSTTSSESNKIEDPAHPFFGKEVLYPTVVNGVRLTSQQAYDHFLQTGEHLGIFDTPGHAEDYATWLHREQARQGGGAWHPEIALPELQPWTSATANIAKPQVQPLRTPGFFEPQNVTRPPGPNTIQGAIPPDAQLRNPSEQRAADVRAAQQATAAPDVLSLREKLNRIGADVRERMSQVDPNVLDALQLGQMLIDVTVTHGSPHEFVGFDPAKINTGEGTQSEGHGFYFGADPKTGPFYHRYLTELKPVDPQGAPVELNTPAERVAAQTMRAFSDIEDLGMNPYDAAMTHTRQSWGMGKEHMGDVLKVLNDWRARGVEFKRTGGVYTADINDAHVAQMLDWHTQINGQTPQIQEFVRQHYPNTPYADRWTGEELYAKMMYDEGVNLGKGFKHDERYRIASQNIAAKMSQAGIPGVRYTDYDVSPGSQNFVVFDPRESLNWMLPPENVSPPTVPRPQ